MLKNSTEADCLHCQVRYKSVFCDLKLQELNELNENKGCSAYKKGEYIFKEGSFPNGIYCVNNGKIKIAQLGDEGREQITRFAKDGDILGYRSLLSNEKYSSSASALDDCSICFIPRAVFFTLISTNTTLSLNIMKLLAIDLKDAEHKMTDLAQKPVRERMAEALLFLKETYGLESDNATINVSLSREEFANMVGTTRESATRLLSEFKTDNMLELVGKKIKIVNFNKLVKTANMYD